MNRITQLCLFILMSVSGTSYALYGSYADFCAYSQEPSCYEQSCDDMYEVRDFRRPCQPTGFFGPMYVIGDFLWWHANQTGMTYAFSASDLGNPFGETNRALQQKSKWAAGFRVGAGTELQQHPCDVAIYWTRFHQTYKTTSSDPLILGTQLLNLSSPLVIGGSSVGGGQPHSLWELKFDVYEIDFAYRCQFNNFLLRPYLGVATIRLDQKQKIKYDDFVDENVDSLDAEIHQKNNYWGVGPKIGISGNYGIETCFGNVGLVGDLSTSLFYGHGNNPVKTFVFNDDEGFPLSEFEIRYKQHRVVPLAQAKIGVSWGSVVFGNWFINFAIQYEVQYLWGTWRNQNSAIQNLYVADAGFGNLMLQGLTFSLKTGF